MLAATTPWPQCEGSGWHSRLLESRLSLGLYCTSRAPELRTHTWSLLVLCPRLSTQAHQEDTVSEAGLQQRSRLTQPLSSQNLESDGRCHYGRNEGGQAVQGNFQKQVLQSLKGYGKQASGADFIFTEAAIWNNPASPSHLTGRVVSERLTVNFPSYFKGPCSETGALKSQSTGLLPAPKSTVPR